MAITVQLSIAITVHLPVSATYNLPWLLQFNWPWLYSSIFHVLPVLLLWLLSSQLLRCFVYCHLSIWKFDYSFHCFSVFVLFHSMLFWHFSTCFLHTKKCYFLILCATIVQLLYNLWQLVSWLPCEPTDYKFNKLCLF